MKKLRRLNFDLIQTEMSVIDRDFLRSIVGGYQDDCFWRCIAYVESGGSFYSESNAEEYANGYFGSDTDLAGSGAAISTENMKNYMADRYTSDSTGQLIQFAPTLAPEAVLPGEMSHVVVFKEDVKDVNGKITGFKVYDPQQNAEYVVPLNSVISFLNFGSDNSDGSSGSHYD